MIIDLILNVYVVGFLLLGHKHYIFTFLCALVAWLHVDQFVLLHISSKQHSISNIKLN